jgi:ABC-2 type transport system ATP-binding protein
MRRILTTCCALVMVAGFVPGTALARDYVVTSFDGTPIVAHFYPAPGLKAGDREPTVLYGPGWGGSGQTDTTEASTYEQVGMSALLKAGYNVLTWDPRGFGGSGGDAHVNNPNFEGRDMSALLDLVAKQPEAQLDRPGDPRAGMTGGSYGGGIQWVTAGVDSRLDAMVPNSSWNSLETSLFPDGDFKMGIISLLYGTGTAGSVNGGLTSPAGPQTGGMDPHITHFYVNGMATGSISPEDADFFRSSGPWNVLSRVKIPTFVTQGTADILFPLSQAIRNYRTLKANGVPVKMLWYCGGHGSCLDNPGSDGDNALRVERESLAWLARYLRGDKAVDSGAGFEWVSQDGVWHTAAAFPLLSAKRKLTATGSGMLALHPSPGSGTAAFAGSSPEGVNVNVPAVTAPHVDIVGEPKVTITYSGTGLPATTFAYAQVVDLTTGHVVGNQATPIPLTLDGASHTITRSLNGIAYNAAPSSRLQLQIIPATGLYREQTTTGLVTLQTIKLVLPTAR